MIEKVLSLVLEGRLLIITPFLLLFIPICLSSLILKTFLSLNLSSITCCTSVIRLVMPMTLVCIAALLSLFDRRGNPTTTYVYHSLYLQPYLACLISQRKKRLKKASSNNPHIKICYTQACFRRIFYRDTIYHTKWVWKKWRNSSMFHPPNYICNVLRIAYYDFTDMTS